MIRRAKLASEREKARKTCDFQINRKSRGRCREPGQIHIHKSPQFRSSVNRAIRCYQLCRFLLVIAAGTREMCAAISDIAPHFSD